jgi:hypothetical protein
MHINHLFGRWIHCTQLPSLLSYPDQQLTKPSLSSSCHASWLLHCLVSPFHCITLLLSVMPAGCCIASHCSLVAPPSWPLIVPASCGIAPCHADLSFSCCPSWLLYRLLSSSHCTTLLSSHCTGLLLHYLSTSSCCATLLSFHCTGWLLRCLLLHHPLPLLSHRLVALLPLIVLLLLCHHLVLSLRRLAVALLLSPPSCPLIVPSSCRTSGCCVASVKRCHHHRTPPPLLPPRPPPFLNAIFAADVFPPPHNCPLPKKEAVAASPTAYQQQHQRENIYRFRQLGLILTYL